MATAHAIGRDREPVTHEEWTERTMITAMAVNPLVAMDRSQILAAAGRLLARAALEPMVTGRHVLGLARELADVVLGSSERKPEASDRRFVDPTFAEHPLYRRLMQSYLAWRAAMHGLVEEVALDEKSRERARFAVSLLTEAVAPTNTLAGNPAALKRAFETSGGSLWSGLRHLVADLVDNEGMPSQVDRRPFHVGGNIAATSGQVVFRSEVLELIQYTPSTAEVFERPVVFIPPQINKFYVLDLAPGRSLVEHSLKSGLTVFTVSWRNPTPAQRDWGLGAYVQALIDATDAVREITGSPRLNVLAACAGGITTSIFLAHLAARGDDRVVSATFPVTLLDMSAPGMVGMFASEKTVASSIRQSAAKGVLSGSEMARVFAWLRPNDLVWNYWVSNYLLGADPPAFDVLYWNSDSTNLPAALHAEFLEIFLHNSLTRAGALEVLDTPIDLSRVSADIYAVGALTDHITPWYGCYRTAQLFGGQSTFIAANSGHIQALVNPPGNLKSRYFTNADLSRDATSWREGAEEQKGSWWSHWSDWLAKRSGGKRPAPAKLGSEKHPPILAAPGRYVHQKHK